MPYEDKNHREAARWIRLNDLVLDVQRYDRCTAEKAQDQIRNALADGALRSRWEDAWEPRGHSAEAAMAPSDAPPSGVRFWLSAQIDWRSGVVFDDDGVTDEGRERGFARQRVLLVLRFSAEQIWGAHKRPKRVQALVRDETECQAWLEQLMENSPAAKSLEGISYPTRKDFKALAKEKWRGLSGRGFDRAWQSAILNTEAGAWGTSGRPKKPRT